MYGTPRTGGDMEHAQCVGLPWYGKLSIKAVTPLTAVHRPQAMTRMAWGGSSTCQPNLTISLGGSAAQSAIDRGSPNRGSTEFRTL